MLCDAVTDAVCTAEKGPLESIRIMFLLSNRDRLVSCRTPYIRLGDHQIHLESATGHLLNQDPLHCDINP